MKRTSSLIILGVVTIVTYFLFYDFYHTQEIYDLVTQSAATLTYILVILLMGPLADKLAPKLWTKNVKRNSWILYGAGIVFVLLYGVFVLGIME